MVEAQGRGTLHSHMLLWLKGNPNPQLLQDRMQNDSAYKNQVIAWLEAHIKCELPGQQTIQESVMKPQLDRSKIDPRIQMSPQMKQMETEEFQIEFHCFVSRLAIVCNWHQHTDTCWKHLKSGEPWDDTHCCMQMNGETRVITKIDPETCSVLLWHLHLHINYFQEVVLFLVSCNMDIKYIGSGSTAKALMFYVTNYTTKASLIIYVSLDAVKYALWHNEECKFSVMDSRAKEKSLFIKFVYVLMSQQELSHQQVISYFVGGGDHYKSHPFANVPWKHVYWFVVHALYKDNAEDGNQDTNTLSTIITVYLKSVQTINILIDYLYRLSSSTFEGMSFWRFCKMCEKITVHQETERVQSINTNLHEWACGRPACEHSHFLSGHPRMDMNMVHLQTATNCSFDRIRCSIQVHYTWDVWRLVSSNAYSFQTVAFCSRLVRKWLGVDRFIWCVLH